MSPRTRILAIVLSAAATAAVVAVGAAVLQSRGDGAEAHAVSPGGGVTGPREGAPPLVLDLTLRAGADTPRLRRAATLYTKGDRVGAGRLFAAESSLDAEIGEAMSRWPDGTARELERLAREHPESGAVRLNLGLARFWLGEDEAAIAAWRTALRVDPDSLAAVRADDLLHPNTPRGLPTFVPTFRASEAVSTLPARRQLGELARRARTGTWRDKILYGVGLQRASRPRSAERAYASALAAAPDELEARVAAAVGRFSKSHPERAFSRLGPLVQQHAAEPTVRFHLGLLLLWLGELEDAKRQLTEAQDAGPKSVLGRQARSYLEVLEKVRTS